MTSTMLGNISGSRLMPSSAFLKKPLDLRTATTNAVPITEQIDAEDTARNRLFQMDASAFGVCKSSLQWSSVKFPAANP